MIGTPLGRRVHEIMSKEWDDDDPGKRRWRMLDGGKNALPLRVFLASCQLLHVSEGTAKKAYNTRTWQSVVMINSILPSPFKSYTKPDNFMFSILFRGQLSGPYQTQNITHNRPAGE